MIYSILPLGTTTPPRERSLEWHWKPCTSKAEVIPSWLYVPSPRRPKTIIMMANVYWWLTMCFICINLILTTTLWGRYNYQLLLLSFYHLINERVSKFPRLQSVVELGLDPSSLSLTPLLTSRALGWRCPLPLLPPVPAQCSFSFSFSHLLLNWRLPRTIPQAWILGQSVS